MKNYCTSFELLTIWKDGRVFPCGRAFTKATLLKRAKKLGLSSYCIVTYHIENLVSTVFKKDYYNA